MWVRRKEDELAAKKDGERRFRPRAAIFMGALVFVIALFFRRNYAEGPDHLVAKWEIPSRVFPALVWGVVIGIVFYAFPSRKRVVVVCTRCGKVKDKDSETKCSCGGEFEDIENLEWKEDR